MEHLQNWGITNNQEIYKDVCRYISGKEEENTWSPYRTGELQIIRKYISMYVDT